VLHQRRSTLAENPSLMSSAIDQVETPRAPRAGAELRAARERVGRSLSQMAESLHIRYQYWRRWRKAGSPICPVMPARGFVWVQFKRPEPDPARWRYRGCAAETQSAANHWKCRGGTDLVVGGTSVPSLGGTGAVRRAVGR
jgi:hypothetical protein